MLKGATHEHVVISESGIYTHQDVLRLAPLCQGFLVGSALMAQQDLPQAVKQLVYGTVKVCGMTRPEQVRHAFEHTFQSKNSGSFTFKESPPPGSWPAAAAQSRTWWPRSG